MVEFESFMKEALKEAKKASTKKEIPIGAIIVKDGKIIARGHNQVESRNNATLHAEMIAIKNASKKLGSWRLNDCTMYVTLEPCEMCMTATRLARIKEVIFGSYRNDLAVPDVKLTGGYLKKEIDLLLTSFFKDLRNRDKKLKSRF